MLQIWFVIIVAINLLHSNDCLSLDCYQCSNITDLGECHNLAVCADDELCFAEARQLVGLTRYTFGCRMKQRCLNIEPFHHSVSLIGRSAVETFICNRCCMEDACNKHLCTDIHEYPMGYHDGLYVRLVDGDKYSGRVEVSNNSFTWGTVCGDNFYDDAAKVVCRMLGYSTQLAYSSYNIARPGTGPIFLDNIGCGGIESSLLQCLHARWGETDCNHSKDIGVSCPMHGIFVRLNGTSGLIGRLEVSTDNSTWGTVCKDDFRDGSAAVVCKMLGLHTNHAFYYLSGTTAEAGPVPFTTTSTLTHVICDGNESSLEQCIRSRWGQSTCRHSQDVGVACPINGILVRLNGTLMYRGRLEVSIDNSTWGTVCVHNFYESTARVVCKMLGYPTDFAFYYYSATTSDSGPFPDDGVSIITDVACTGTESSLVQCRRSMWGDSRCTHGEDVGVACPVFGLLARLNGVSQYHGRLEVSIDNSTWGTVCSDYFTDNSAKVVCRVLGYPTNDAFFTTDIATISGSVPNTTGSVLTNLNCKGTESNLMLCGISKWGDSRCTHAQDVEVACPVYGLLVRLNGSSSHFGRLEVSMDNTTWGTVCNDRFDDSSAKVACKMLGYPADDAFYTTGIPSGLGPIPFTQGSVLTDVSCRGTESSLLQCSRSRWGSSNCRHAQDVIVACPPHGLLVRLVDGGRVEVSIDNSTWGTMCYVEFSDRFSLGGAKVVCRMLGLPTSNVRFYNSAVPGSGPVVFDSVSCTGSESSLLECRHSVWGQSSSCRHFSDVAVTCGD